MIFVWLIIISPIFIWDSWTGIGVFFMAPNGYGPRLVSISCRFSSIEVSRFRAAQDSLPRGCPVSGHCDGQSITTTKSPFPYVFFFSIVMLVYQRVNTIKSHYIDYMNHHYMARRGCETGSFNHGQFEEGNWGSNHETRM